MVGALRRSWFHLASFVPTGSQCCSRRLLVWDTLLCWAQTTPTTNRAFAYLCRNTNIYIKQSTTSSINQMWPVMPASIALLVTHSKNSRLQNHCMKTAGFAGAIWYGITVEAEEPTILSVLPLNVPIAFTVFVLETVIGIE